MKISVLLVLGSLLGATASSHAVADDVWTYPVLERHPAFDFNAPFKQATYTSLSRSEVTKPWNICFLGTAFKDPIYIGYAYGAVEEAKRLGVNLTILEAGGYTFLDKQISQMEDCAAQGSDAIIAIAISPTGLNQAVDEVRKKGIVFIDAGNGVTTAVDGRNVASYYVSGQKIGEYLKKKHPAGSAPVELLWLPGPAGVSWVENATKGIQDALKDSAVKIVQVMYGDTGKTDQLRLVEDGLQAYPNLKYIAGAGSAVEAAQGALREQGRSDIFLLADYTTPGTLQGVRDGTVLGTVIDPSVINLRLDVDMAVRILEGKAPYRDSSPELTLLDSEGLKNFDEQTTLAPAGWSPVFRVDAQ